MPESIEEYVRRERRLHPLIIKALAPYFDNWSPARIRVLLKPEGWWVYQLVNMRKFVIGQRLYLPQKWLNRPVGGCDLSQAGEWRQLARLVYRAYQWKRDGRLRMLWRHLLRRWQRWSRFEIEASRETETIIAKLRKPRPSLFWDKFRELQCPKT